jgi:hypothetical protein
VLLAGVRFSVACGVGFSHFFWGTLMKKIVLLLGALALVPAFAQTSVGVSVGINQPGVYGRIDIGNFPQPRVIYPQPVVIVQSPIAAYQRPVYLYVPPGHQKNWAKHCGRYNACGQPVYFVQEDWVRERYEERRGHPDNSYRGKGHGNGNGRGHGKGNQ